MSKITKIYEDNAGGIHAVVLEDGKVINVLTGLEFEYTRENKLTGLDLIHAAQSGFEYADDYDPDDYEGRSMEDVAEEIADTSDPIAYITLHKAELCYENMGSEGLYLFGDGERR